MGEGARREPEGPQPVDACIRRIRITLDVERGPFGPEGHHQVDVLCRLGPVEGRLQLVDQADLGAVWTRGPVPWRAPADRARVAARLLHGGWHVDTHDFAGHLSRQLEGTLR